MNHSTATRAQQEKTAGHFKRPGSEAAQRMMSPGPYADVETLQHHAGNRAVHGLLQGNVPPIVQSVISSGGQPLDPATQAEMEARFGEDFSQVRVHTDARAAESAEAVSAKAYTVGNEIVLGKHGYAPSAKEGRRILAHELTHVVQQQNRRGHLVAKSGCEQEAAQHAREVASGEAVQVESGTGSGTLQRQYEPTKEKLSNRSHPPGVMLDKTAHL
jgi:hypothetical protein